MTIPFIDLRSQYEKYKSNIDNAISNVLEHGQYIMGPEISELESQLSSYLGVKHTLACSSGTDALLLPLMTKSLSSSCAVFTTPFTFFASAESISLCGAVPVFTDIEHGTYNMCPEALEKTIQDTIAEGRLTPKGIMAVDLFGLAANFNEINRIAKKYDLFVIEDAAQSFGAKYHGSKAGALGEIGATSFYPAKPLGCYGDGGAVFTDNTDAYEEMVSLRVHGQATSGNKYDNVRIGLNARMDTIQAAVLLEKLKNYEPELKRRNEVAKLYTSKLKDYVKAPTVPQGQESVWAQYTIQVEDREGLKDHLAKQGVPTAVFYPIPVHLASAYTNLGYAEGDFPVSEAASKRVMSLPMHPFLDDSVVCKICDVIIEKLDK